MEGKSDADARREARRRRILQNSDDRLRKIRGYDNKDEESKGTEDVIGQTTLLSPFPPVVEVTRDDSKETKHFPPEPIWQPAEVEDTIILSSQDIQSSSVFSKLCNARVHIILLAIMVRLLLFSGHGYLFSNMVLVPLILVQLTELILPGSRPAVSSGGLLGAAMMLSGFTQSRVHRMLYGACILQTICVDLTLYLFSFCLIHVMLEVI